MKKIDHSWDFAKANTKYYTHGIHTYPAMMIPQVAKRLIKENSTSAKVGLDPFCGSGSVLLEFKLAGIKSYGVDINPLATLISKVKTTPVKPSSLFETWMNLKPKIYHLSNEKKIQPPVFFNIDFWFKEEAKLALTAIKQAIDEIKDKKIRDFFLVCFSETVRKASNTRGGEFKLYRIKEEKLKNYAPDAKLIFQTVFEKNRQAMECLYNALQKNKSPSVNIIEADLTKKTKIWTSSTDLLVTSPPYGDSRTTVAYGQFSRLSSQWLGCDEKKAKRMDNVMMGGIAPKVLTHSLPSKILDTTISTISKEDEKRARDVLGFFSDFYKAAEEINRIMKDNSRMCFVVGNRTVKGVKIPMDKIIIELFKEFNFNHDKTSIRHIPSKRMPRVNSPTNKPGVLSSTMNEEHIVLLKR